MRSSKKSIKALNPVHKYLIINLNAFIDHPNLAQLTFARDQQAWSKFHYNSFAVSETHKNIALITVIALGYGAYWRLLAGKLETVRPLI